MPVTRFDVRLKRPLAGGAAFGDVGPYDELKGTLRFSIDPKHAANERITDVALAPRDHSGRVEFESDVSILVPVDRGRARGRVMLDVVNRGNTVAVPNFNRATRPTFLPGSNPDPPVDPGDGFLMRRGYVVISCGWQIDLPEVPGLLGLRGPEALDALRDAAAWLKHGTAREGNPAPDVLRYVYAYGRSQTGRLLRTLVFNDLNLDEQGREALDGIIANVAGGLRGEFNQRFGQNSKDRPHMMDYVQPATDEDLHRRLTARASKLKVFYTNSSAEYHRGDASLAHTNAEGTRDVANGPSARVYHFAGTEHGLGVWPPTAEKAAAADPSEPPEHSQNLRNTIDYAPLLRACLVNLDRWVTEGVEPPPSRHPRLAEGTAVAFEALHAVFDRIPGASYPCHHARPCRLDFSALPPRPGPACGSLVSAVDADGNEVGGIALPEVAVPLGTHTGWTLRHPSIGGEAQRLVFAGATIPFARTRLEREAAGDPRPSIEERYRSREDYLERVRRAGAALVTQRYMLEEDVELEVALAARAWDHWTA